MKRAIRPLLITLALAGTVYAQAIEGQTNQKALPGEPNSQQAERVKKLLEDLRDDKSATPILPDASSLDMLDESTKAKFFVTMREYYDYRISGYHHRRQVFNWQLGSSKVIFFVVILLVVSGVYFSGVQFHSGLRASRRSQSDKNVDVSDKAPIQAVETEVTEFSASVKGIKVSSPVLGVIILVISLAFFYLYLTFVYPINEVI